jgi:hypothetical protein
VLSQSPPGTFVRGFYAFFQSWFACSLSSLVASARSIRSLSVCGEATVTRWPGAFGSRVITRLYPTSGAQAIHWRRREIGVSVATNLFRISAVSHVHPSKRA